MALEYDDLEIVDEFLADSDDSYDPEGERDEASSESSTHSEEESDNEGSETKPKTKSPEHPAKSKLGSKPDSELVKKEDAPTHQPLENQTTIKTEPSAKEEPEEDTINPLTTSTCPSPEYNSPYHSPICSPSSPPSPPFKNIVEDADNDKWATFGDNIRKKTTKVLKEESEESETDEERPVEFEMPKRAVVIKGTKEEADKAVNGMRNALAQLTKLNLPFLKR